MKRHETRHPCGMSGGIRVGTGDKGAGSPSGTASRPTGSASQLCYDELVVLGNSETL